MSDRLRAIYERVTTWQRRTFPRQTAASILAHMRKELAEIEDAPDDIEERADMAILAMGVFDRAGLDPQFDDVSDAWTWGCFDARAAVRFLKEAIKKLEEGRFLVSIRWALVPCSFGFLNIDEERFLDAISAKMDKNEARKWPSPSEQVPGETVEHIREEDLQFDAVTAMLAGDRLDEAPSEVETLRTRVAELEAERAEWRADNERLRAERRKLRTWLQAQPHEGPLEAAARLCHEIVALRNGGGR